MMQTTTPTKLPPTWCPNTGDWGFEGAQYARKCKALPQLCSCMAWNKPEVFKKCPTYQDTVNEQEDQTNES